MSVKAIVPIISLIVSPLFAQTTVPAGGLTTANGSNDQTALCPPANGVYPQQWTWDPSKTLSNARDAQTSDNLTPKVEQHRTINGVDTIVAIWSSLSSLSSCQEIFTNPPAQPPAGQPFTAAQLQPYTPAQLQQMASTGCGPFGNSSHIDDFRRWQSGDTFLVYPAVYTGTNNNITLKPSPDYYVTSTQPIYAPNNVTIQGLTRNGIRPVIFRNDGGSGDSETSKDVVEIIGGTNDTIQNIGVTLGPNGNVIQAGVYLIGVGFDSYDQYGNALAVPVLGAAPNKTVLTQLHVSNFELMQSISGGANGIFGDPTSGGTVAVSYSEIDHNGGSGVQNSSGPGHGIYMAASNTAYGNAAYDPNFKLLVTANWFHDQFYGHDVKSRAQYTTAVGNYFQGGRPQGGIYTQANAFNLDVPNGGVLDAYNNIFVKDASGYGSGLYNVAYGEEGFPSSPYDGPQNGPRTNSINLKFNTHVAFASTIDGTHPIVPFEFSYPGELPSALLPASKVNVSSNAFVGFCPTGNPVLDYRGTTGLQAGFADITQTYSLGGQWVSSATNIVGTADYVHVTRQGKRTTASVGGED